MVQKAAALEMPALAITDNGNMFGAVDFYLACKSKGINGILGLDAYIAPHGRLHKGDDKGKAPNRRIVLLARNYDGYQALCKISTIGYQEGFYYKPRIDYEVLKQYSQNIIALSGGLRGDVAMEFFDHGAEKAIEKIKFYQEIYPDNFYLEIQRPQVSTWSDYNKFLIEASKITGAPLVATNEVHYLEPADSFAQEVLICIGSNKTLQDESRFKLGSDQFYLKSAQQMRDLFYDLPEACDNTLVIANKCKVEFKLKDDQGKPIYHLPSFPTENGRDLLEEITERSKSGLELRFKEAAARGEAVPEDIKPTHYDRLEFELKVIHNMGFSGYFLIVQDFINWAKNNDIPVGPGRGSGAGSIIAYSLRITDVDPIKNKLIFERFLNPERVSMPDFDVDFCQYRRGEVIQYVNQKYGEPSVSQIITFGKMQARAALRDVGRVMGMNFQEVDVVSKLMPDKLGITLDEAIQMEPRIKDLMESEPRINTLLDIARRIEGLHRHASIHAAGVIISSLPLVTYAPLYKGVAGENVLQYDMKAAEKIGLIKFDFLGLKTLTHIDKALKMILKNRGKTIKADEIRMDDAGIYQLISKGDTAGVFQFEGSGITEVIKRVKPTCFEDIVAVNALFRPGPMQMIDEFIARKHGLSEVKYNFSELEEILNETYGIIVYQEQVQLIASRIANYSLGEADLLRRAMGKKIQAEMDEQRQRFLSGALKNNHDVKKSEELFDLMAKFAEYGFNKSHAVAYCVIAAQTAWIKSYYPVEFFAALLSTELGDTDKVVKYVKDARRKGIEVRQPDINESEHAFAVRGDVIYFGLGAIKGVGEAAVEAIIEARSLKENKKFVDVEDFFMSIDLRRVNKKVIESLTKAGAFDSFGVERGQMHAGYEKFIERSESARKDKDLGQESLFGLIEDSSEEKLELPVVEPWSPSARLNCEKEVLGFYLSDHPLNGYGAVLGRLTTCEISDLSKFETKKRVLIGGIIGQFREMFTRKGTRMCFAQLEDLSSTIELIVFPDAYAVSELMIKSDMPLVIEGSYEKEEESQKIIVEKMFYMTDRMKNLNKVRIMISEKFQEFDKLKKVLQKYPGKSQVFLDCQLPDLKKRVTLEVSDIAGVNPTPQFFEEMYGQFKDRNFVQLDA